MSPFQDYVKSCAPWSSFFDRTILRQIKVKFSQSVSDQIIQITDNYMQWCNEMKLNRIDQIA